MAILKIYDGSEWLEIPILDGVPGGELGGTWASPTVDTTHSGSAHHAKYTGGEAITAVEGEATLDLAGILGLGKEAQLDAISTPMNPASSKVKMFARINGGNIEIIGRGPTGAECVICTVSNVVHTNKLALNWIE